MDPISLAIGGGGALLGGLKSALFDGPREARERKLAAETQRYSPWTKLEGKMPTLANPFGDILQGGTTGLMLGQGMSQAGMLGGAVPVNSGGGASPDDWRTLMNSGGRYAGK